MLSLSVSLSLSNITNVLPKLWYEPDGAGKVQSVLLRPISVSKLETTEGRKPVQKVEHKGDNVHWNHHQDPERVAEGL